MQSLRIVPHLVVEVAVAEHAPALLGPLLFAQASLDAALAILEASSYLGFHLKYLRMQGRATLVTNSFPCKCRGISSFFTRPSLRKAGDTLVHGLVRIPRGPGHSIQRVVLLVWALAGPGRRSQV